MEGGGAGSGQAHLIGPHGIREGGTGGIFMLSNENGATFGTIF